MKPDLSLLTCLGLTLMSATVLADVQTAGENNFSVTTSVSVKATSQVAWEHLLEPGSWWSSSHTWSGDSKNLSLSVVPGGGFDEKLDSGGFVRHMNVVYSDPGKILRMAGLLGPLQEHALQGTMTISFSEDGEMTKISATYRVSGHFQGGLDKVAPLVDKVLAEQLQRLGNVIERKPPVPPEKQGKAND